MAIQGLRDTSNFVADQRPKNWRESIMLLYPNGMAPLTALTSLMRSESTNDPEYNWWEKSMPTQRLEVNADHTDSDTVISVASGALQLKEGHVLRVEQTTELLYVSVDPSSDTSITVVRGWSGSTAAAIDYNGAGKNPYIHVAGTAYEEGSLAPTGINYDPTKKYNYTQIFRNTMEMTRTAQKTRLRTGDQVKEARRECLELHSIEMEKAFWFGKRSETTLKGKPVRTTGGVLSWIDSGNIVANAGTAVKMTDLEGWLERIFRVGSSEKMGFAGNLALLAIQQTVRKNNHVHITPGIKEYGMNVSRLVCPFGELVIKTHPLFNQLVGGTNAGGGGAFYGMNSSLVILDQKEIKYRYITDTKYEKDLQTTGMDGMKAGWLTEAGIEVHHPTSHFWISGMTSGAVDS